MQRVRIDGTGEDGVRERDASKNGNASERGTSSRRDGSAYRRFYFRARDKFPRTELQEAASERASERIQPEATARDVHTSALINPLIDRRRAIIRRVINGLAEELLCFLRRCLPASRCNHFAGSIAATTIAIDELPGGAADATGSLFRAVSSQSRASLNCE